MKMIYWDCVRGRRYYDDAQKDLYLIEDDENTYWIKHCGAAKCRVCSPNVGEYRIIARIERIQAGARVERREYKITEE